MYLTLNNYSKAIEDFTAALNINPYKAEAYYNRGIAYKNIGRGDLAMDDFNKACQYNRNLCSLNQILLNI